MRSPAAAAVLDAAAILAFVTVGLVSHDSFGARGYARDALPFLGCWFAVAALAGLYRRGGLLRLAVTWAVAVPAAVLIRSLLPGRSLEPAFLIVSLVTIAVLVAALRLLWWRARRARP